MNIELSEAQKKEAKENLPEGTDGDVYYNPTTKLYYIVGGRRNALVYCKASDNWRASTRYNHEIKDTKYFVLISS